MVQDGETPLTSACTWGKVDVVRLLLDRDAKFDAPGLVSLLQLPLPLGVVGPEALVQRGSLLAHEHAAAYLLGP